MPRKKKGKKNDRKYLIRCDWCTDDFNSSRPDTKTCSGKCRQRLAFFVKTTGYTPEYAPGPKTAQDAVDLEIVRLFRAEAARRKKASELSSRPIE